MHIFLEFIEFGALDEYMRVEHCGLPTTSGCKFNFILGLRLRHVAGAVLLAHRVVFSVDKLTVEGLEEEVITVLKLSPVFVVDIEFEWKRLDMFDVKS